MYMEIINILNEDMTKRRECIIISYFLKKNCNLFFV